MKVMGFDWTATKMVSIYLIILVGIAILGCTQGTTVGHDDDCDDPPPPPPSYDYEEDEPNDTLEEAQFITLLPVYSSEEIHGTFWLPYDADCYSYFLNPPLGAEQIWFHFVLECDPTVNPKVKAWQTIYDDFGTEQGHQLLGTWVASDGQLVVLDLFVPYDSFYNNDLLLEIIPWAGLRDTPLIDDEYILEFWTD